MVEKAEKGARGSSGAHRHHRDFTLMTMREWPEGERDRESSLKTVRQVLVKLAH